MIVILCTSIAFPHAEHQPPYRRRTALLLAEASSS
jgi:hypothetical protein